jgi:hypothetical protein
MFKHAHSFTPDFPPHHPLLLLFLAGTVVSCARAGADYGNSLVWVLIFSSSFAFIFFECSARLTIVSGHDLAENIAIRFGKTTCLGMPIVPVTVVALYMVGSLAFEANNFVGALISLDQAFENQNADAARIATRTSLGAVLSVLIALALFSNNREMVSSFSTPFVSPSPPSSPSLLSLFSNCCFSVPPPVPNKIVPPPPPPLVL